MGIDGRGLIQVGPADITSLAGYGDSQQCGCLAWQPHGGRLALVADRTLFILRAGQNPLQVVAGRNFFGPVWSPDGKILLVWDGDGGALGVARAFSPTGRPLWSAARSSFPNHSGWSRRGLLALSTYSSGLRVYDERGHLRFAVREKQTTNKTFDDSVPDDPGWSPDGRLVAADFGDRLEVVTAAGRRVLQRRVRTAGCGDIVWANNRQVLVGDPHCDVAKVDIRSGRLSRASSRWFGTRSADGKLAAVASQQGLQITVGVAPTAGGPPRTYTHLPACRPNLTAFGSPLPVDSLQFAGRSHSLVYTSDCPHPYTNLYSVAPDGSGLQQLTTSTYAEQPVLSPDGTRIAYSWRAIWIRDSTGAQVALTSPNTFCAASKGIPSDVSPSWSPDGTTILFERPGCPGESDSLYTVSASGGAPPHDLGIVGQSPAWGPSKIAYITRVDFTTNTGAIWTANPDGTDPVHIATDGSNPAWSPDGRLAYLTGSNTVVVDSAQTRLPFTKVASLAWSPDGTRFAVVARTTPNGPLDVYTVNTDGSDPIQLTQNYGAIAVSWR